MSAVFTDHETEIKRVLAPQEHGRSPDEEFHCLRRSPFGKTRPAEQQPECRRGAREEPRPFLAACSCEGRLHHLAELLRVLRGARGRLPEEPRARAADLEGARTPMAASSAATEQGPGRRFNGDQPRS